MRNAFRVNEKRYTRARVYAEKKNINTRRQKFMTGMKNEKPATFNIGGGVFFS